MTLSELADRIEAEMVGSDEALAAQDFGIDFTCFLQATRDSSIDAAVKLLEEVLPGWKWMIYSYGGAVAYEEHPDYPTIMKNKGEGKAPTPAAALVAAILRAKEAQDD